ncbi:hypothetical protein F8M41_004611, partial [Gigaspora margarita]
MVVTNKSNS